MGTLHEDVCTFMAVPRQLLLRMRGISVKSYSQEKTHILRPITFSQKLCHLWDNV